MTSEEILIQIAKGGGVVKLPADPVVTSIVLLWAGRLNEEAEKAGMPWLLLHKGDRLRMNATVREALQG